MIAGALISILTSLPGVAGGVLTWLNKKTDADLEKFKAGIGADTAINVEEIRTRVDLARIAAGQRDKDRDHWSTAWMVPATFAVCLTHFASVVFDSIPMFGHKVGSWGVATLPGQYATMQNSIMLTICGVAVGGSILKRIFSK